MDETMTARFGLCGLIAALWDNAVPPVMRRMLSDRVDVYERAGWPSRPPVYPRVLERKVARLRDDWDLRAWVQCRAKPAELDALHGAWTKMYLAVGRMPEDDPLFRTLSARLLRDPTSRGLLLVVLEWSELQQHGGPTPDAPH